MDKPRQDSDPPPLETAPPMADPAVSGPSGDGRRQAGGMGRRRSAYATRDLTTGSIPRNLVFLAWPQVAEGALNTLDGLLDIFWAGRGIGARAIASIGVAQNYIMFVRLGRQGIDIGTRAMVARSVGAGDLRLANHMVLQAFTVNILLALVALVPGIIFTEFLLRLLGVSDALIATGKGYMQIQFLASASQGFRMMAGAVLQASGDTLTPMKASIAARVVDWILTPLVMFGWLGFPILGLNGVAWINTLSGAVGLAINMYGLFSGTSKLHLTFRGYYLDFPFMGRLLKLSIPASVTSAERSLAQLFVIGIVARFGDYAVAAWALSRRVEASAQLGSQGLGNACGVIAGQSIGAGRPERARQTLRWAVGYVLLLKVVAGSLLFAFPTFFISIFNQEPEMLVVATGWLRILVVGFFLQGPTNIFQQTFQVAGDTILPLITVFATVWLVEIPLAVTLSGVAQNWSILGWTPPLPAIAGLGQYGVAWAVSLGMGSRLFIYVPYFFWGPWMRKEILGDRRGAWSAAAGRGGD